MEIIVLHCLIAYLIGTIPFGLLLTKFVLKQDIRSIGSGNIGATNVLRTGNKKLAALTLLLDALKGAAPIILFFGQPFYILLIIGLAAILGHCFPVWLKFKGGKGVATAIGVLLAAVPFTGFLVCLTWIISFLASRMSSLAAISAMVMAPAFTYAIYGQEAALVNIVISALVIWRHRENIKRICAGTESKFTSRKNNLQ